MSLCMLPDDKMEDMCLNCWQICQNGAIKLKREINEWTQTIKLSYMNPWVYFCSVAANDQQMWNKYEILIEFIILQY